MYSNVFDLKNGNIYHYYMSQYGKAVKLNLVDELKKGQRIVEIRDLFSTDTVIAGDAAYQSFETRFRVAQIVAVVAVLALVLGGVVLVVKKFKLHSLEYSTERNEITSIRI